MSFAENLSQIRLVAFTTLGVAAKFRKVKQLPAQNIDITAIKTPDSITTQDYDNREQALIAVRDTECSPNYSDIFTIDNKEYLVLSTQKRQYGISYFNCVTKQEPNWQR